MAVKYWKSQSLFVTGYWFFKITVLGEFIILISQSRSQMTNYGEDQIKIHWGNNQDEEV